jgi:hypothetical protein
MRFRLWLMESVRAADDWLHRVGAPGRWWCDLADRVFWWAMSPYAPRPKDLP